MSSLADFQKSHLLISKPEQVFVSTGIIINHMARKFISYIRESGLRMIFDILIFVSRATLAQIINSLKHFKQK